MRRGLVLLAVAVAVPLLPAPAPDAATATTDVYRSHFLARDRSGRAYSIDAMVEDRPAGAQLVLEIRRRCPSCRAEVYARELQRDELIVRYLQPASAECRCMSVSVTTKFGGKELRLDWVWDLEQNGGPSGGGYQWATVTANNLMNLSCFGSGTFTTTPDPLFGGAPEPPAGAEEFPKKMPGPFKADLFRRPGCYAESP